MKKKEYQIRVRVWIEEKEGAFIGMGRLSLLENIKKTGSISSAAKRLNMSYRKAWQLVKDMNARANMPLVDIKLGGNGGGGSTVTKAGEETMKSFYLLQEK